MIFLNNMQPIAFHPYTSIVCDRFLQINYRYGDSVHGLETELIGMFLAAGIPCHADNKIVFELLDTNTNLKIFVGFYDWTFSVGHSYRGDL